VTPQHVTFLAAASNLQVLHKIFRSTPAVYNAANGSSVALPQEFVRGDGSDGKQGPDEKRLVDGACEKQRGRQRLLRARN
jgi:hypothetical protein